MNYGRKPITVILLMLFLPILFSLSISDVLGYSFVGVTSNGVEFPIYDEIILSGNGTGKSILDGLGVYLTIDNINSDGVIYFGEDNNPGEQTDIRGYVAINPNDNWAIAIIDGDYTEVLSVPEFGREYRYESGGLVESNPFSNVLGYSESNTIVGSVSTSISVDGISISGTGEIILKLNNYQNQTLILRGDTDTAFAKIITSSIDLINAEYTSGLGYLSHSGGNPGTSGISIVGGIDSAHTGKYDHTWWVPSDPHRHVERGGKSWVHEHGDYEENTYDNISTLVKVNNGDHQIITGHTQNVGYNFRLWDTLPSIQGIHISGGVFETNYLFPNEQSYLYVKLNDETLIINGESFDPDSDAYVEITGLPENIAYDISKSGITGVLGKTSSTGVISLLYNDVDFGVSNSPGGILSIYPNSTTHLGEFDIIMIDVLHDGTIQLPVGDNLVYVPQNYVRWVFPIPVEVENLRVDNISLNYLNKNYTKNEALMVPVIPGANTIYSTINGEDVEILMRDVSVSTQIKQVPKKSSTISEHTVDGAASVSSNISTGTYLTATHTGMMYVNLDFKVGGNVDFSMDSAYVGGFKKSQSCNWHGASSPSRSYSCHQYSTPNSPGSIDNLQTLTVQHQNQLTAALNSGQASNLTVEVDIIRNMGADNDVETILIYTSDSAVVSVSSTFSEARYGASNQVRIVYPLTTISDNVAIPVTVGDMVEFVVRVNLDVAGAPTPSSVDAVYSSYVQATTEFGGGIITVGMS